jgi:hypothetical protein
VAKLLHDALAVAAILVALADVAAVPPVNERSPMCASGDDEP